MSVMCLVCVLFHGSLFQCFFSLVSFLFWNVIVMCMGGGWWLVVDVLMV